MKRKISNLNDGVGDPCAGQLKLYESVSVTAKSPKLFELDENFGAVDPMGSDQCKHILYINIMYGWVGGY